MFSQTSITINCKHLTLSFAFMICIDLRVQGLKQYRALGSKRHTLNGCGHFQTLLFGSLHPPHSLPGLQETCIVCLGFLIMFATETGLELRIPICGGVFFALCTWLLVIPRGACPACPAPTTYPPMQLTPRSRQAGLQWGLFKKPTGIKKGCLAEFQERAMGFLRAASLDIYEALSGACRIS